MRLFWAFCGFAALALGLVGIFLPLLPTVPFLLLAAFCFARSSERMHLWLTTHPVLGPPIRDWQASGAISLRAKRLATASMAVVLVLSIVLGVRPLILSIQAVVLACAALFIWTRPSA
ncbi:YbaN family protein [Fertoebacter nigrum]|uniref:YbaN family protein n=1 Tax=Fertoeibacter niger TaxID=2656921 RepID=A0A8X8H4A7_9RHOB|nr:YbaN family protein [Fertoeibacter niger]NUB45353.1 YbaN family protein [Fertoeibacter niger]